MRAGSPWFQAGPLGPAGASIPKFLLGGQAESGKVIWLQNWVRAEGNLGLPGQQVQTPFPQRVFDSEMSLPTTIPHLQLIEF